MQNCFFFNIGLGCTAKKDFENRNCRGSPWFHILSDYENSLFGKYVCRKERDTKFMIKLPVFKKKKV